MVKTRSNHYERIDGWLRRDPDLEFKLDPTPESLVTHLAGTDAVRTLDRKGYYEGTDVDQSADPALYELILEGFPGALVEDSEDELSSSPLLSPGDPDGMECDSGSDSGQKHDE